MSRESVRYPILDSASENGAGNSAFATDFRHCIVTVDSSPDADMTLKFLGSNADPGNDPDFDSPQSVENNWDTVQVNNYGNGDAVTGDTGLVISGETHAQFEFDTNGLDWVTARIFSYVAGEVTVRVNLFNE